MAEKTILEKAAEKVGYGLAMVEDVASSVKKAIGGTATTPTEPPQEAPAEKVTREGANKALAPRAAKETPRKSVVKKTATNKPLAKKTAAKNAVAKKTAAKKKSPAKQIAAKKSPAKRTATKKTTGRKASKKTVKTPAKKSAARR